MVDKLEKPNNCPHVNLIHITYSMAGNIYHSYRCANCNEMLLEEKPELEIELETWREKLNRIEDKINMLLELMGEWKP